MTVAPLHCVSSLAQALVALAKVDAVSLCQANQNLSGFVAQPGVGRIGDGLLLYRGIDVDPLQMLCRYVLFALGCFDGDFEQFLHHVVANPLAPFDQTSRVERELVLKVLKSVEVLPIAVFDELGNHSLIADVERMLEVM